MRSPWPPSYRDESRRAEKLHPHLLLRAFRRPLRRPAPGRERHPRPPRLDPLGNCGVKTAEPPAAPPSGRRPRPWPPATPTALWPWAGSAWTKCRPTKATTTSPAPRQGLGNAARAHLHRLLRHHGPALLQIFGKSQDSFRRTMAEIAVKNRGYAQWKPLRHGPKDITVDECSTPGHRLPAAGADACLMSVGAACVIVADEETAHKCARSPSGSTSARARTPCGWPTGATWRSRFCPTRSRPL